MKQWIFMVVLCTLAPPTEAAADAARRAQRGACAGSRARCASLKPQRSFARPDAAARVSRPSGPGPAVAHGP